MYIFKYCYIYIVYMNISIKYQLYYLYLNIFINEKNFLSVAFHRDMKIGWKKQVFVHRQLFKDSRCIQIVSRDRSCCFFATKYFYVYTLNVMHAMQKKRNPLSTGYFIRIRTIQFIVQLEDKKDSVLTTIVLSL